MKPPKIKDNLGRKNYWHINLSYCSDNIHVQVSKGWTYSVTDSEHVYMPTWLEELRGITFKDKVDKTIKKCQNICNRKNDEEEIMGEYMDEYHQGAKQ